MNRRFGYEFWRRVGFTIGYTVLNFAIPLALIHYLVEPERHACMIAVYAMFLAVDTRLNRQREKSAKQKLQEERLERFRRENGS